MLGISKRGDSYLRKLLIHGARATLRWARTKTDSRSQWIRGVLERRGWNRTAVAVANKNARRLLLDSGVVDVPMVYNRTFVLLSSLKPLFFNGLKNALCFSDNAGA